MYLYREADSFFHRLHPITKLLLLFLMIVVSLLTSELRMIVGVFAIYMTLLLLAKGAPNLKKFWKMLAMFWIFTFLIWIIVPQLRHVSWNYENAAMLATRIDTFVLAGLLFVTSTRIEEFTYGMTRLGLPYKVAFALSLGFRLVPLFYQNLQTIVAAQKSRGVDLDSANIFRRTQLYIPMIGILISYAIRNADLMAMALEAKGFGYSPKRTSFLQPTFGIKDASVLLLGTAAVAILFV
jgi:energy-coupling factor transport system permease protein